ncbi:MAG: kelch repeat-containing protein [Archangiaceae bacterium]|nr:kelch repeat-containing protein [Archangiaceae bacterium]
MVALGGKIYVVGGFVGTTAVGTVEAYDPATREWVDAGTLPLALHHANVAVVNGKLYVVGGLTGLGFVANRAVYEYDPGTRAWAAKAQLPLGTERGGSAVGVSNGLIYLAGGYRQGASVADFTTYDPASDQHRSLPALPKARDHLVGGVVGSTFFAIGGRKDNVIDGRVDRYDLLDGGWSAAAPMLTARAGSAAGIYGSRIIVAGGEGNTAVSSGVFPQTEIYDSVNDRWADAGVMLTPRHGTGGAVVGDTFYLPGGATLQGFGATSTVEAYRFGGP